MEDHTEQYPEDQPSMPPPIPLHHEPPYQKPPLVLPPRQDPPEDIPPLKPNNWLWQSIVVTILCCLPLGIVGIVYAAKVDSLYYNAQYDASERAAGIAKMWSVIAFTVGILYVLLWIILFSTGNMPANIEHIIEESASGYNF